MLASSPRTGAELLKALPLAAAITPNGQDGPRAWLMPEEATKPMRLARALKPHAFFPSVLSSSMSICVMFVNGIMTPVPLPLSQ